MELWQAPAKLSFQRVANDIPSSPFSPFRNAWLKGRPHGLEDFFGSPCNSKEGKGAEDLLSLLLGLFQVFKCPKPPTLMFSSAQSCQCLLPLLRLIAEHEAVESLPDKAPRGVFFLH